MDDLRERAAQARREYQRAWRAANKERVREMNRRYWERQAEKRRRGENAEATTAE